MKKLSNIEESVWGDIRKRGNGTDVKKEDDVNHLDMDDFYDYLNKTYVTIPNNNEPAGTLLLKINMLDSMSMLVLTDLNDIYRLRFDNFSDKDRFISFPLTPNLKKDQLYHRLKENYLITEIVTIEHGDEMHIYPRNVEVNNSFYVELIDFILENTGSRLTKNIKRK